LLDKSSLRDLLSKKELSAKDKLLLCLAADPVSPRQTKDIRELAVSVGLRSAKTWNVSSYLSKATSFAVRTNEGWELTADGMNYVFQIAGPLLPSVTPLVLSALRKQIISISDNNTKSFVEESIKCFELSLYRSAIVFSWVGAIAVLQSFVHGNHLLAFNTEALRRDLKWRKALTPDDIGRMKEYDFLQVLHAISVLGKNVKDELEVCLKLRNGCGHPNSLVVGEHKASAHIETLMQNVFSRF
jgi:hypothetical protein